MFLYNTGYIIFTKKFCNSFVMHLSELHHIYQKTSHLIYKRLVYIAPGLNLPACYIIKPIF